MLDIRSKQALALAQYIAFNLFSALRSRSSRCSFGQGKMIYTLESRFSKSTERIKSETISLERIFYMAQNSFQHIPGLRVSCVIILGLHGHAIKK